MASGDDHHSGNATPGDRHIVTILAPPMTVCKPGVQSWSDAAQIASRFIESRYGEQVSVEFIEMFSPESFRRPEVLSIVERDSLQLPVVLMDERVISSGGKISLSAIGHAIEESGIKRIGSVS